METDTDELTIVNRSKKYRVSKSFICSSVPYFEKMFSCNLTEAKEKKVVLDFDEKSFDLILNWLKYDYILLTMDCVIAVYDIADYLMMDKQLLTYCINYFDTDFRKNFSVKSIPVVISQVSEVSKLVNASQLDAFICRHFLKIVNTTFFPSYSIETLEYILQLDLMVTSEYQVFEAIIKWIQDDPDSRITYLERLLKHIRGCYLSKDDLEKINDLTSYLPDCKSIICTSNTCVSQPCGFNRSNQSFFIVVYQIEDTLLKIKVLDVDFKCLLNNYIILDTSISPEFMQDEHVTDIFYDLGKRGIRVDWVAKKFRYIPVINYDRQIFNMFVKYLPSFEWKSFSIEDPGAKLCLMANEPKDEKMFIKVNHRIIIINRDRSARQFMFVKPDRENIDDYYKVGNQTFLATASQDSIYILTNDNYFIEFDTVTQTYKMSMLFKDSQVKFKDLILTSNQDKVITVHKSTGKINVYDTASEKWNEVGQMKNRNSKLEENNKILTFTSTFLPLQKLDLFYKIY